MKISVVAPVYNEEKLIYEFYERTSKTLRGLTGDYEIILVNDGSKDKSKEIMLEISSKDTKVKVINFIRNFGHQSAIYAGIKESKGDVIITIDSDLQDQPELIPELINKHKEGYDIVYAKRNRRKGETIFKRLTAYIYYRLLNSLSDTELPVDVGDYRLITKRVKKCLMDMPEKSLYLRGLIAWTGFPSACVLYDRDERKAGQTNYTLKKMINLALNGITSFSDKPLKLSIFLGFFTSILTTIYMIYVLVCKAFGLTVTGWASMIILDGYIGAMILIGLGIQGIYISKIYAELKSRPLYIKDRQPNNKEEGKDE